MVWKSSLATCISYEHVDLFLYFYTDDYPVTMILELQNYGVYNCNLIRRIGQFYVLTYVLVTDIILICTSFHLNVNISVIV